MVCGCLVRSDDKVLLCKRGIQPRKYQWTFPAGFLERGETTREGAQRETREEAQAEVSIAHLYLQYDLAYIGQVYQFYLADLTSTFAAGDETLDVKLYAEDEIPWDDLAFAVVRKSLSIFFEERKSSDFNFHHFEVPQRSTWDTLLI